MSKLIPVAKIIDIDLGEDDVAFVNFDNAVSIKVVQQAEGYNVIGQFMKACVAIEVLSINNDKSTYPSSADIETIKQLIRDQIAEFSYAT